MANYWKNFINDILLNLDDDCSRDVEPIEDRDKKMITALNEIDAIILWHRFMPDSAKYALLFERTYGESAELPLFDESEANADERNKSLYALHANEVPVLIYWNSHTALKTNWGMFVRYWDNFFYYPEDAIVFVDKDHIYFYNDMVLKRLASEKENVSDKSVFECLAELRDKKTRESIQMNTLLDRIPQDFQEDLYRLFFLLSESFRVIDDKSIGREYMDYCLANGQFCTQKIILASRPYSKKSLQGFVKEIEKKDDFLDCAITDYYNILRKLAESNPL